MTCTIGPQLRRSACSAHLPMLPSGKRGTHHGAGVRALGSGVVRPPLFAVPLLLASRTLVLLAQRRHQHTGSPVATAGTATAGGVAPRATSWPWCSYSGWSQDQNDYSSHHHTQKMTRRVPDYGPSAWQQSTRSRDGDRRGRTVSRSGRCKRRCIDRRC